MKLKPVRVEDNIKVQDLIIYKIRNFIDLRKFHKGDKLPSERMLSDTLNISRRSVREAIDKLEFYGLVKSIPKSGLFISTGSVALIGIMDGMLTLGEEGFLSLVEARLMLENKAVFFAANRRSDEDLDDIEAALNAYKVKVLSKENALEEDLLFHLAIAKASKNSTIYAMMLQMIPKLIAIFKKTRVCSEDEISYEVKKHEDIFQAIKSKDVEQAVKSIEFHFEFLIEYCNDFKKRIL